jgi:HK97 family phage portal protein
VGLLASIREEKRASAGVLGHPRDPVLAQWLGLSGATASDVNITPANARECPEVDACVGLIEDTIATVPLDLYQRVSEDERSRVPDHPLHELLHDRPNEWQTSAEFRQMMEGWRSVYGNAYARIIPGPKGFPGALEPFHPDEGRPFKLPTGGVAVEWTPLTGPSRILMPNEVLHLKDKPFTRNLVAGQSRVVRHREVIGRAQATGQYLSRFFSNGAVPKTFLEQPDGAKLTGEQMKDLRDQFESKHGGLVNMRRIGILNAGMKINQVGSDNSDAQVIESYSQAVGQIARVWGIPLHMIGDTEKVTSWGTGIEQQSIGFVVYSMRPKFVMWEQALNRTLMSADSARQFYFEFNVDGLLRGDFKTRMEGYGLLMQWGLMTVNEIRRQMNLAPVAGGDERMHPLNYAPATRIMEVLLRKGIDGPGTVKNPDQITRALAEAMRLLSADTLDQANGGHA